MSDPVSKSEIEDVLSSIRRLVSEESRVEPRRVVSRERAASDRLVLTPSLRVAEPAEPAEPADPAEPEGNAAAGDDAPESLILRRDAAPGQPAQAAPSEPDPDTDLDTDAEGDPWRDPEATLFASARVAMDVPDLADQPEESDDGRADPVSDGAAYLDRDYVDDDAEPDDVQAVGADAADSDQAYPDGDFPGDSDPWEEDPQQDLSADQPQFAAADSGDSDRVEETHGAEDETGSAHDMDDWQKDAETVETVGTDLPDAQDGDADTRPDMRTGTARVETLSAKIQALEEAIGRSRDQWDPDDEGTDDYAGTRVQTIEWEDHTDDAVAAHTDPSESDPDPDDSELETDVLTADEAFLDEDSLRELVADIVREELQGALGERITRNVRKLVRREIHRALTAQEME